MEQNYVLSLCTGPSSFYGYERSLVFRLGANPPLPFNPIPSIYPLFFPPFFHLLPLPLALEVGLIPSLLFLPCPSLSSLPLEVDPLYSVRGSGERSKLPPAGPRAKPQPKSNLVHFSFKIRHLVATILMIFLRIDLPNFVQFKQY